MQPGDTLSAIADRHGLPWQEVYKANRRVIGTDPNLIFPGQELVLDAG